MLSILKISVFTVLTVLTVLTALKDLIGNHCRFCNILWWDEQTNILELILQGVSKKMRLDLWIISRAPLSFVQPKFRTWKLIHFWLFFILKRYWAIPFELRNGSQKFQHWFKLIDFYWDWDIILHFINLQLIWYLAKLQLEHLKNQHGQYSMRSF